MLRAAVKSARVEAKQRAIEADAEGAKALAGALAGVDRKPDARNLIDDAGSVHRRQERGVVIELMSPFATTTDAVRQQQTSRIRRISPAFADAGRERDHRGAERIREDHGAAKASRLENADAVARAAIPRNHFAEQPQRRQQGCDVLRRGDGDAAFAAEAMVQRPIGWKGENVIADPIEPDYDRVTRHSLLRFPPS